MYVFTLKSYIDLYIRDQVIQSIEYCFHTVKSDYLKKKKMNLKFIIQIVCRRGKVITIDTITSHPLFFFSLCIDTYSFENIIIDIRAVAVAINRHIYMVHTYTLIVTTTRSEAVSDSSRFFSSSFFNDIGKMKEIEMSIKKQGFFRYILRIS
jgi:hypothetical protein